MHWKLDLENDPLAEELLVEEGLDLSACTQNAACSAVCPTADSFDFLPHQVVRQVQVNERKRILRSSALWLCTDCGACTAACPQQVDVARLFVELRRRAYRGKVDPAPDAEGVKASHEALLEEMDGHGRPADARVALSYKMRAMDVFTDWTVGAALWKSGQLAVSARPGGDEGPVMVERARLRETDAMFAHEDRAELEREFQKKSKKAAKKGDEVPVPPDPGSADRTGGADGGPK